MTLANLRPLFHYLIMIGLVFIATRAVAQEPRKRSPQLYRVTTPTRVYENCYYVAKTKGSKAKIIDTGITRVITRDRPVNIIRCP